MTRTNGIRLLLVTAATLLLLTCTVAAWALPHTRPTAPASLTASAAGKPCGRIIGPARDYCMRNTSPSVAAAPAPERAALWPGVRDARAGLLLFSTAAVAAAIALVSTAGRRL
ncbi:hypothetical protein ACE1OC_43050 (plasmid) [Streptomyces sp. DSM 116496]|uniref:hypothetical protein n=1 Tax=Streptomyces stoeckheimensis TaxID=3344656 RepID=UPI0038B31B9D